MGYIVHYCLQKNRCQPQNRVFSFHFQFHFQLFSPCCRVEEISRHLSLQKTCTRKKTTDDPTWLFPFHLVVNISTILITKLCEIALEFIRSTSISSPTRHFPPRLHTTGLTPTYVGERVISPDSDRLQRSSRECVGRYTAAPGGHLVRTTSQGSSDEVAAVHFAAGNFESSPASVFRTLKHGTLH